MHADAAFIAAMALSAAGTLVLARLAPRAGLLDHPGGRKAHARAVPLVGGLAIFAALALAATLAGVAFAAGIFLACVAMVVAVGAWDDLREIAPRWKLAVQVLACGLMIWGADVQLRSVGDLLGWRPIGLMMFSVPLTIFAVVGVANAVNMMDGLDGLAGSIAFVAFAWYAAVAYGSGVDNAFVVALIFCGAIGGFLLFNLRLPGHAQARVFLGDAGSLSLGFALGWFAVDLTQGTDRAFPPIAALWVVLLPLADCVSLMARRIRAGRSPFAADRRHIHHYLQARGLSATQSLALLVAISTAFGAVGYFGWRARVPEPMLFWPFFFGYFGYHFWIQRAWRALEADA
ncbi:MraY family glycosyltransferase [Usitatibacter palustris]|uniref:Undecaprenyl-phosphate alpha-N-acetylglucosaminyl 1-phosphate transferase n=1 Tax=Usitatibacter palustris TaxID=2732487 RepID=A0A6M4H8M5_9PROT|nr:MraY family glycosyltransferase [Usitatibacter palustris]QJR15682.1 Undecaprenyl-phosphate alpha-N-acetylglucosaminyl 1-phosphate transferase [Usitatibacter palustris]